MSGGTGVRRAVRPLVVVLGLTLAGALAGVLWEVLWTPPTGAALSGEFVFDGPGNRVAFAGTASFVVIGLLVGLVAGLVLGVTTRRDELLVLAAAVVGGVLATVAMYAVGVALGPADPATAAQDAADLTPLVDRLRVYGRGPWVALTAGVLIGLVTTLLGMGRRDDPGTGGHGADAFAAQPGPEVGEPPHAAGRGPALGSPGPAPPVGGR